MPSAKVLEAKKQQVDVISKEISGSVTGLFVDYSGITVEDDTKLRADLRKAGVSYHAYKNSLIDLAIKGSDLASLSSLLTGATAVAISKEDYTAAAHIISQYVKNSKSTTYKIKGGYLDGEPISLTTIDELANLPSREVLLSMVANVFQAPMAAFARAIKAVADKMGEPEAAAPAAPEAAPAE